MSRMNSRRDSALSGTLKLTSRILGLRTMEERSVSPGAAEIFDILEGKRMHSFTRRMKSFNKKKNPDLVSPTSPPSYMRQTCASLSKRAPSIERPAPPRRCQTATPGIAGRVSSRGRDQSKRRSRRTISMAEHSRTTKLEPNDQQGFFMGGMPANFDWTDSNYRRSSRGSDRMQRNNRNGKNINSIRSDTCRRMSTKSTCSDIGRSASRASSKLNSGRVKDRPERKSDSVNNISPRHIIELDSMDTVQFEVIRSADRLTVSEKSSIYHGERSPQPLSTIPLKDMDVSKMNSKAKSDQKKIKEKEVAANKPSTQRRKSESIRRRSASQKPEPKSNSTRSLIKQRGIPTPTSKAEPAAVHKTAVGAQEVESEHLSPGGIPSSSMKTDSGGAVVEPGEISIDTERGEDSLYDEQEGSDCDDWKSVAYTTGAADEILSRPFSDDPRENVISEEKSTDFSEAASSGCSSEIHSDSEEEIDKLIEILPPKKKKSFLRRLDTSSKSKETAKKRKLKTPRFLRGFGTRSSLQTRIPCIRFSFKACFCGAEVSPGPEVDDELQFSVSIEQPNNLEHPID